MSDDWLIDRAFAATGPFGIGSEQTFSGALSLFRRRYAKDPAGADVPVLGIPFDLAVSNRPGTGTPVCGGPSTNTAERILCGLRGLNIVGMDVVEVPPAYDVGEVTALAGATMALNMLCLWAEATGNR